MSIITSAITSILPAAGQAATGSATGGAPGEFASLLEHSIQGVENTGAAADKSVADLLAGNGELHTAALAVQRAELSFELAIQVRNKVVSAYQEIMRMQL